MPHAGVGVGVDVEETVGVADGVSEGDVVGEGDGVGLGPGVGPTAALEAKRISKSASVLFPSSASSDCHATTQCPCPSVAT